MVPCSTVWLCQCGARAPLRRRPLGRRVDENVEKLGKFTRGLPPSPARSVLFFSLRKLTFKRTDEVHIDSIDTSRSGRRSSGSIVECLLSWRKSSQRAAPPWQTSPVSNMAAASSHVSCSKWARKRSFIARVLVSSARTPCELKMWKVDWRRHRKGQDLERGVLGYQPRRQDTI